MTLQIERSFLNLKKWKSTLTYLTTKRDCYTDGGLHHLDEGGPTRKRDPNCPKRAKIPAGPKLGTSIHDRVPFTYGKYNPHYHIFRKMVEEPTLLKTRFGTPLPPTPRLSPPVDKVAVPLRKHRSPTAVLEALSSTVQVDLNGVPYDFIDDPNLIPMSPFDMFQYRKSKAMGKRAARQIVEDKPFFFDHEFMTPEPKIPAFQASPAWIHDEVDGNADDVVLERLQAQRYDLAFHHFETATASNKTLSNDVLSRLFEVAAINNYSAGEAESLRASDSVLPEEVPLESNALVMLKQNPEARPDTWKLDGVAEDIWRKIKKTDASHCCFVKALVLHGSTARAWEHYNMMIAEDKVVDLDTFHLLLKHHNEIPGQSDDGSEDPAFRRVLQDMADRGVTPTIDTFNCVLYGLADKTIFGASGRRLQNEVLNEIYDLNIPPTLGTFGLMAKNMRNKPHVIDYILNFVESTNFRFHDEFDFLFFPIMMSALAYHVHSPAMAHRLFDLLKRPNQLQTAFSSEDLMRVFCEHYLLLLAEHSSVEEVMSVYTELVPSYYMPKAVYFKKFLEAFLAMSPTFSSKFLVKLYNDLLAFVHLNADYELYNIFSRFLVQEFSDDSEKAALGTIAFSLFDTNLKWIGLMRSRREGTRIYSAGLVKGLGTSQAPAEEHFWGSTYNNLILSLSYASELEKAFAVFQHYVENQSRVQRAPPVEGVAKLMESLAESSLPQRPVMMVEIMKFFDEVGAKKHLSAGLQLMLDHVLLDTTSALVVAQLQAELRKSG